jgi:CheY-like chemotaxis protein
LKKTSNLVRELLNPYQEAMSTAPIILIADRNDEALNYLKEELATDYALLHARDGQEVLSIVEAQTPHIALAVIELELPGVNGLSLIGRLTSHEPKPKKIIATTFLEHDLLFEVAKHMGADAVVRKPRPEETWVGKLRRLLPERLDAVQPGKKPTRGRRRRRKVTRTQPGIAD